MARLLYRLGTFSARHRALLLSLWAGLLVLLAVAAVVGFQRPAGEDPGFEVPGTESSSAFDLVEEEFSDLQEEPEEGEKELQLVLRAPEGEEITAEHNAAVVVRSLDRLADTDHVVGVADPLDPTAPYISEDLSTVVIGVSLADVTEDNAEEIHGDVVAVAEQARDDGLTAEVGGTLDDGMPEILGPTEIVGAALAFIVLAVTFRSLLTAGANMAGALLGVGVGITGVFAWSLISPVGSLTPILAVMLGLAVGIDYCLFILARFRAELVEGRPVEDAVGRAVGTAGSSVVFAGATVVIALVGLAVVNISFLTQMGLAAAFAVAMAVLMSLTFLPVLMRSLGRRALPRRQRSVSAPVESDGVGSAERIGFLERWASFVVRRRVIALLLSTAALLVLAVPFLDMRTALNVPGGEDPESTQRAAYELVEEEFGGTQSPLVVLVQAENAEDVLPEAVEHLDGLEHTSMVFPAGTNEDGTVGLVQVIPEAGPLADSTQELVHAIRADADALSGAELLVTGETAMGIDSDAQLRDALVLYVILIVGLSLVLLTVLFRSVMVPLVATLGFLLSLGAALGATTAVFQWGWLDFLVQAPQGNPLLSLLPIIVTGILFGLAMDYQVFLVSRMHEAYVKGMSPKEAILDGFGRSAPVVVAAAAIMAAVFGGFALSPSSLVGAIAFALTVGVVVDAFVVRMVIVPALLAVLGRAAWWLPSWLGRVLPDVDTEGRALEGDGGTDDKEPLLAGTG
ncbi:MMPL family transporter [Nocardiopsis dassonvillei]|uniref:MMPL family transporter n=1 Tax=Nocardiopsis dassonvillei TaxID=2014 RepID=UPI00366A693B